MILFSIRLQHWPHSSHLEDSIGSQQQLGAVGHVQKYIENILTGQKLKGMN